MKQLRVFFVFLPLCLGLGGGIAQGGQRALDELLYTRNRPSISDVIKAVGLRPTKNPYEEFIAYDLTFSYAKKDLKKIPAIIAFMEASFPGATWAPLGRDAVIFGDLLDAFYLGLGQKDRVIRLNASTQTFQFAAPDELVDFLHSAGFDPKKVGPNHPFVAMDRTSFRAGSQSRRLLDAMNDSYRSVHGDTPDLHRFINFLGLSFDGETTPNLRSKKAFFEWWENGGIKALMQLPVGHWTDSQAWHMTFEQLAIQQTGKYEGTPGAPYDTRERKTVLGEMIWILQQATKKTFVNAVLKHSKTLHFEFPDTPEKLGALRAAVADDCAEVFGEDRSA